MELAALNLLISVASRDENRGIIRIEVPGSIEHIDRRATARCRSWCSHNASCCRRPKIYSVFLRDFVSPGQLNKAYEKLLEATSHVVGQAKKRAASMRNGAAVHGMCMAWQRFQWIIT